MARIHPEARAKKMIKENYDFIFGLRLNCELASDEYCMNKARELSIKQTVLLIIDSTSKHYWETVKKLIPLVEIT